MLIMGYFPLVISVKPSKEMQGALKVLNDALLRGKTTEHVTNAIGIILHEWFRVGLVLILVY